MARSLWKGAISFGLVHIPVEMYPATRESSLDLTMLDKRDFSPIGFKRYNKSTQGEVAWENIVKGYEYTSGEYVVLSDEDLKRANVEATQTIDILAFVDAEEVPLLYHNQPYYLAPGKGGDKVYALLRETLRKAGKIGIANVVIRVKQHLAALVCVGDVIVMETLRYADEIRPADELKIPKQGDKNSTISDKELKMALALVEGMSEEWKPEQYHDTYREDVLRLVEEKVAHNETKSITMPGKEREKPAAGGNVIDLVALLQQSIGTKPGAKPAKSSSRKAANDEPEEEDEEEEAAPAPKKRTAAPRSAASKTAAPRQRAAAAAKPKAVARTTAKAPAKAKKTA